MSTFLFAPYESHDDEDDTSRIGGAIGEVKMKETELEKLDAEEEMGKEGDGESVLVLTNRPGWDFDSQPPTPAESGRMSRRASSGP